MDCITKCVESISGEGESEFGNLTYSPLGLKAIRERQVWSRDTLHYTVGNEVKGAIHLHYNYLSQRGLYPDEPDKENQDAFKIVPRFDGEDSTIMMGVFDGHGEYGDDCANFVRDNIEEHLSNARHDHGNDLEKAFRTAFRTLNSEMHYAKVRAHPCACGVHASSPHSASQVRSATDTTRGAMPPVPGSQPAFSMVRTFPTRSLAPPPSSPSSSALPCGWPMSATRARSLASSRMAS